jgi:formylmethanofuran dehydrogenase subunit C
MKKRSLILSLALLVSFVGADMAGATCVQQGKISRLRSGSAAAESPGNFVDVQEPGNLPSFATFFVVGTDRFFSLLGDAQAANSTVIVTGNAASCPTTGTFRNGGTVIGVDVFKNQ